MFVGFNVALNLQIDTPITVILDYFFSVIIKLELWQIVFTWIETVMIGQDHFAKILELFSFYFTNRDFRTNENLYFK